MLEKNKGPARPIAFLIAVDVQDFVDQEQVKFKLMDAVGFMEGCGSVEIECLGPIDCYDEKEVNVTNTE